MIRSLPEEDDAILIGELRVLPEEFVAELRGRPLSLTNKEFRLLVLFARNPRRLLRREVIADAVWDGPLRGRTIDVHVARLRAQLPKGAIETVIRLGYRFVLA